MKIVKTKRKNGSTRIQYINEEPSKTDPSQSEDCDINTIVERYTKTGQFSHLTSRQGIYTDVSEVPNNLQEATLLVQHTQSLFESLPALVRSRFDNNPTKMLAFLQDSKNKEEAQKLGLLNSPSSIPLYNQPPTPKNENDLNENDTTKFNTTKSKKNSTDSPNS